MAAGSAGAMPAKPPPSAASAPGAGPAPNGASGPAGGGPTGGNGTAAGAAGSAGKGTAGGAPAGVAGEGPAGAAGRARKPGGAPEPPPLDPAPQTNTMLAASSAMHCIGTRTIGVMIAIVISDRDRARSTSLI